MIVMFRTLVFNHETQMVTLSHLEISVVFLLYRDFTEKNSVLILSLLLT